MLAEDYEISGLYLRGYLAGLRRLTGNQYPRLLEMAGLGQYSLKYPPPTVEIIAKGKNLIALNQAVRQVIGSEAFNLFLLNLGREFGRAAAEVESLQKAVAEIGAVRDRANFSRILERVVALTRNTINENIEIREDPDNHQVLF